MPSRNRKATETRPSRTQPDPSSEPAYFPFARYTSVVGVHTSLLAFTALLLPGTTPSVRGILARWDLTKSTEGRDILRNLTENPLRTLAWICTGALILQCWWASWIKQWSSVARIHKPDSVNATKQRMEGDRWKAQGDRAVVRSSLHWQLACCSPYKLLHRLLLA